MGSGNACTIWCGGEEESCMPDQKHTLERAVMLWQFNICNMTSIGFKKTLYRMISSGNTTQPCRGLRVRREKLLIVRGLMLCGVQ